MKHRFSIAALLNLVVVGALFGVGCDYLLSSRFKPHHEAVLDVPWSDFTPRTQLLMLTLMKGTGFVGIVAAVSLAVLVAVPFRRREPWSRWAILLVGGTTLLPMLLGALKLRAETGGGAAWWPHVAMLSCLGLAFGLTWDFKQRR